MNTHGPLEVMERPEQDRMWGMAAMYVSVVSALS